MSYAAPARDLRFALEEIAGIDGLKSSGAFADLSPDLIQAILEESGKLAADVLAPLNKIGDREGVQLENGVVRAAPGFGDAYQQFVAGGWQGLPFDPEFGGMGLPRALSLAVSEMMHGANMSFALAPMLTLGAIEALQAHGTPEQKATYLPKLISGEWTGTMNLTEPQAGSDVGALTARAVPQDDGSFRIFGQKIYITWGDHDMAANTIHLVLARTPSAPIGSRGVSLFIVPKFLPKADGSLGHRNDVRCIGLEHKMGIHGSPTCTMAYGEVDGAIGWLIGEENKGLAAMFTMMNSARLNVGIQGVGVAEAAFQKAFAYAQERKQGKAEGWSEAGPSPILHHADVRRMLMTMKAKVAAARAICFSTAVAADLAETSDDPLEAAAAKLREELFTPIAKGWSTEVGVEIASLGVQIHGGMGFVEEGGAAQFYRDARIAAIYEGTNGIQAIDLVGRKLGLEGGAGTRALIAEMRASVEDCLTSSNNQLVWIGERLQAAVLTFEEAATWLVEKNVSAKRDALAGATPFLELAGDVVGGWMLAKGGLAAQRHLKAGEGDSGYYTAKIALAGFFAENILARAPGKLAGITAGSNVLFEADIEALTG
jgi:3-(methylthio)propanoyl-CoA dehydrogenase